MLAAATQFILCVLIKVFLCQLSFPQVYLCTWTAVEICRQVKSLIANAASNESVPDHFCVPILLK